VEREREMLSHGAESLEEGRLPVGEPSPSLMVEAKPEAWIIQPLSVPDFASFTSLGSLALILWDEMKSSGKLSLMPILYIELGPESHMRRGTLWRRSKN